MGSVHGTDDPNKPAVGIDLILETRQETHGPFKDYAIAAQGMKSAIEPYIVDAPPFVKEGLDMILGKIARVATGSPVEPDHWLDIQGYAKAVQNCLEIAIDR